VDDERIPGVQQTLRECGAHVPEPDQAYAEAWSAIHCQVAINDAAGAVKVERRERRYRG
jgi:hypothetical protein